MAIDFSKMNKTNNHLSPSLTEYKKIMIYGVGNVGPDLSQAQTCGGVKPVNGIPTPPLDNRNLNVITFINKR